jgi:hypothetical protein
LYEPPTTAFVGKLDPVKVIVLPLIVAAVKEMVAV